jgi:hypothetical protein
LFNDDVDIAGLDLGEVTNEGGGSKEERVMDSKVVQEDLTENEMLTAIAGGMGVQKTTDAGNQFTHAKKLNDELYSVPMEDQMHYIVSVGGPTEHTKAASCYLRVAGYFAEEEELEEHSIDLPRGNYLSSHAAVAYHVGSKKFTKTEERQVYIDGQLARWDLKILSKGARFDEHVDERSNFKDERGEKEVDAKEKVTFAEQKKKRESTSRALREKLAEKSTRKEMKKKKAKELKGSHALIDQSWMCLSLMYDLDEEDLPIKENWIYVCWGAFPSKKIARGHISDTLQHDYCGMKHYVVKMYKWLPLDIVLTKEFKMKVKGIYKTDEQQALWDGAHNAKPQAQQYKKKREEMERTVELKKMLEENKGLSTAELLKQQLEEDDETDVNVETVTATATTTTEVAVGETAAE